MRKLQIVFLSLAIASSPAVFSAGDNRATDAEITARVKAALIDNEATKARQIDVETRDGIVQLSGFVDSAAMQEQALLTARSVAGVKEVRNDLALRGHDRTAGEVMDDTVIATRVKAKIADDADLAASSDVNVEVNKGVVQLSGFVASTAEKTRAADVADDVKGVRDVRNNIALARAER